MNIEILKSIIIEQNNIIIDNEIERDNLKEIHEFTDIPHCVVITGMRRTGKSTLLRQIRNKYYKNKAYIFSFEDERLLNFTAENFNDLYEAFLQLYPDSKIFFLDEIQNIENWELFVRRMQDRGYKFFLTGSNATMLSKELATRLTGRSVSFEMFPFSFKEFLKFNKFTINENEKYDTKKIAKLKSLFTQYLKYGGMPEYLKYKNLTLLKYAYEDILYRDIVSRYDIQDIKALRNLAFFLISNIGNLLSFNKIKSILQIGSVNTVKNYIKYLENSYLIFTINKFSFSLKQQAIANKKIYIIDNGLIESIAFQFSNNSGKYLENLVFITLKKQDNEIYYHKTKSNFEIDFLIKNGKKVEQLIQVSENIDNLDTKNREIRALFEGMEEFNLEESLLLTLNSKDIITKNNKTIQIIPVYEWLL